VGHGADIPGMPVFYHIHTPHSATTKHIGLLMGLSKSDSPLSAIVEMRYMIHKAITRRSALYVDTDMPVV
jgi:hypothetical protein